MKERWLIRVIPTKEKAIAVWIDKDERVLIDRRELVYPIFLFSNREEKLLALRESLQCVEDIHSVLLEEWLAPPWYDKKVRVLRVLSKNLNLLKKLGQEIENRGVAQLVNTQPGSFLIGLKEAGLKPCYWLHENNNNIVYEVPPLKVLLVSEKEKKTVLRLIKLEDEKTKIIDETQDMAYTKDFVESSHVVVDYADVIPSKLTGWRPLVKMNKNPVDTINGLVELCRLSYMDLELVSRSSIGEILTTIEAFHALEKKMLIPKVRVGKDSWRDLESLLDTDRGGLIGSPLPGIYFNVAQLDFSSLYPSIIAKYNISPETINKPDCKRIARFSDSPHIVCLDRPGLVSTVLKELVERREAIKRINNKTSIQREKAIKWILVASFGYLGYRNSRFGNIHAYETVTWISRDVLRRAISVVEQFGYRVIHFIVDSIFVTKNGEKIEKDDLSKMIEKLIDTTGFNLKVENIYRWLVIPETSSLHIKRGATNRYYGLTINGSLVIKGSICDWKEAILEIPDKEKHLLDFLLQHRHPRKLCEDILHSSDKLGLKISFAE